MIFRYLRIELVLVTLALLTKADRGLATSDSKNENPYLQKISLLHEFIDQVEESERRADDPRMAEMLIDWLSSPTSRKRDKKTKDIKPNDRKVRNSLTFARRPPDLHRPTRIQVRPEFFPVPASVALLLREHIRNGLLHLDDLTPSVLREFSQGQLAELIDALQGIEVQVKWEDQAGKVRSEGKRLLGIFRLTRWVKTNAAAALAIKMGSFFQPDLLAQMIAVQPGAILSLLEGDAASLLDVEVAARSLVAILSGLKDGNTREIVVFAEAVAYTYIKFWAGRKPDHLIVVFTRLVAETSRLIDPSQENFSAKQKGILLGALLAASISESDTIKSADDRRLWLVNSISNLAWAATTFIGAVPVSASITAPIAGVLSTAVVVWAVIYNKRASHDFIPGIHEVEGHIEVSALETIEDSQYPAATTDEVLSTLAWMGAASNICANIN